MDADCKTCRFNSTRGDATCRCVSLIPCDASDLNRYAPAEPEPQGDLFAPGPAPAAPEPTDAEKLAAAGLKVVETMTTPTRPGKRSRPVWNVIGNTIGLEEAFRDAGGRKFRGAWSFFADPTDDVLEAVEAGRASYAEELEAKRARAAERADRRAEWAEKAERRSEAAFSGVRRLADSIPLGQPILVGHHSERRARADCRRIDNGMRRGVEEAAKAAYHRDRAAAAEATASGDHTRAFCANRIADAERELRDLDRRLTGTLNPVYHGDFGPAEGEYREQLLERKAYQEGKRDYWKDELVKLGGGAYSRETVKKGDLVKIRGGWTRVVRTNPKTVTVRADIIYFGATLKYKYEEIQGYRALTDEEKAKLAAADAAAKKTA